MWHKLLIPLISLQNGEDVDCFHIRNGIVITTTMDDRMCDGIAEYLLKLAEFPPAPKGALKKDVEEPRAKLAEMVALAFWPGPTADVDIISTPDGVPGQTIRFNYTRSGSTNLVFLPAI